eukprot:TRINITY_DN4791_c0_g1_i1.p2 TRINITY_DN4791_c0_g1~~TRINITY_DN4791_c0_g1_i1.p2  ORF type:complete len:140 (-),score=58.74 TRINITY_DN4791_c0_g1_i1:10-402(-)
MVIRDRSNSKPKQEAYNDIEFPDRYPTLSWQEWKLIENEVMLSCRMSVGNDHSVVHPHKKSFVICPGLIYGMGEEYEEIFGKLFFDAWNCGENEEDGVFVIGDSENVVSCLLYTSPSPRDLSTSRMPSSP